MRLIPWLLIVAYSISVASCGNYYFYVDIRSDSINHFSRMDYYAVPHDHFLRPGTSLEMARKRLENKLRLWSASPKVVNGTTNNRFYWSASESTADCKTVAGLTDDNNCYVHANYDIGSCSPKEYVSLAGSPEVQTLHCKNNPRVDQIVNFHGPTNESSAILQEGERIILIKPNGAGLSKDARQRYRAKFGKVKIRFSLSELNARIKFIRDEVGANQFAGIIGSTDNAYYTAIISKQLAVPNIVPSVTDSTGTWPLSSSENYNPGILDSTLVLGYEDWMIIEQLVYIVQASGWHTGAMQVIHESGYSEKLATNIQKHFATELHKIVPPPTEITEDITFTKMEWRDQYVHKLRRPYGSKEASSGEKFGGFRDMIKFLKRQTRCIVLIGKFPFVSTTLKAMELYNMYNSPGHNSDSNYGIVIIPETGGPVKNVYEHPAWNLYVKNVHKEHPWSVWGYPPVNKDVLEGAFLISHGAHNRDQWTWPSANTMSSDGTNEAGKHRYQFDPPSMNTESQFTGTEESIHESRKFKDISQYVEPSMISWNKYEFEARTFWRMIYGMKLFPPQSELRVIDSLTHDSLVWGMVTAWLNRTHPGLFVTQDGEYTLANLYGDGLEHPDTRSRTHSDLTRVGWPGMIGRLNDSVKTPGVNGTIEMAKDRDFLINDGPWNEFVNRYTFKDNRPFGSILHTINLFQSGEWKKFAGYLPHRRPAERDGIDIAYEVKFTDLIANDMLRDTDGNKFLESGVPMNQNYKFIRFLENFNIADTNEGDCGYDGVSCALNKMAKNLLPIGFVVVILLIIILVDCLYFGRKRRKAEREVNAQRWKLDPEGIEFKAPGMGIRSSMLVSTMGGATTAGGETTMGAGTTFGATTVGGGTTLGGGTTMGGTTVGGTTFYGTEQGDGSSGAGTKTVGGGSAKEKKQVFADLAVLSGKRWAVKTLKEVANAMVKEPTTKFKIEMKQIHELVHVNLLNVAGVVYRPDYGVHVLLTEYCAKGSLQDVLEDSGAALDINFKLNFVIDIIRGMDYLQNMTELGSHGYLKSSNILITGFYTAKIADFGTLCRSNDGVKFEEHELYGKKLRSLWTAPEILRDDNMGQNLMGTRAGDVYSFGIICHEIMDGSGPFNTHDDDNGIGADEVLEKVKKLHVRKPYRPVFSGIRDNQREVVVMGMAQDCWKEDPSERPSFQHLRQSYIPKIEDNSMTIGQCILHQIKMLTEEKEKEIRGYDTTIKAQKEVFGDMQQMLLPAHVIHKVAVGQVVEPAIIKDAPFLNLEVALDKDDMHTFMSFSQQVHATVLQLVRDRDLHLLGGGPGFGVWVIVGNCAGDDGADSAAQFCSLVTEVARFLEDMELPEYVIRAGMDSGHMTAVVVGERHRYYQVYSDACENAEIMRKHAANGKLLCSQNVMKAIGKDGQDFSKHDAIPALQNMSIFATDLL